MTEEQRIRIGRAFAATGAVMAVVGLGTAIAIGRWQAAWNTLTPVNACIGVGFGALAWTVLPRQPRNRSVWSSTIAAFFGGLYSVALAVLVLTLPESAEVDDSSLIPAELGWQGAIAASTLSVGWMPAFLVPLTIGLLLFPDGDLPSPRWRWALRFQVTTFSLAFLLSLAANSPWSTRPIPNPGGTLGLISEVFINLVLLSGLVSVASLVVRYRKGDAVVRHQIRWIAFGGTFVVIGELAKRAIWGSIAGSTDPTIENVINLLPLLLLIGSFWVAIAKYRLYDIDSIISKSVTYLGLGFVIVGLYATVVVVVPLTLLGQSDDEPGLVLPIVAAALVAVVFEPVRARMQVAANRLVYGDRASPHEVLSQVTSSLADTGGSTADLARLLARGTGAEQAVVRIASGDTLRVSGAFPESSSVVTEPVAIDALGDDDHTTSLPVLYRGELFGSLTITKPANDPITPDDRALLADVAAGSGLLLRNIGLNSQLEQRASDVRASRHRLIAAQDAERHRLERDLHDGAQQQVVALKVKLGIAQAIAEKEGAPEIAERAVAMANEAQQAVDALRAVAHGIYPPLLESEGLEAALRAIERTSALRVRVTAPALGRYGRQAEETAYFCVLETIDRARMLGADAVQVTVEEAGDALVVALHLVGIGTDANVDLAAMADRIDAFGGTTSVETGPSGETQVVSFLPLDATVESA